MADSFDPYLKWLGIAPKDQPPNHYRLLGIDPFTDDPDVIENAADRQRTHVRSFQSGRHAQLSQKLLNEISAAKICLLDAGQKEAYDRSLKSELAPANKIAKAKPLPKAKPPAAKPPQSATGPADFIAFEPGNTPGARSTARTGGNRRSPVPAIVLALIGLAVVAAAVYFIRASMTESQVVEHDTANRPVPPPSVVRQEGEDAPATIDQPAPRKPPAPEAVENPALPERADPASTDPVPAASSGIIDTAAPPDEPAAASVSEKTPDEPSADVPSPPETDTRHLVPDDQAQARALDAVREVFQQDNANAKTPEQLRELAGEIVQAGIESREDPAAQFVLLRVGRDLAATAGDAKSALDAVDRLAERFQIDATAMKLDVLARVVKQIRTADEYQSFVQLADPIVTDGVRGDRFDDTLPLAEATIAAARRTGDLELVKQAVLQRKSIEAAATRYRAVERALEVLATDADDADANLAVGKYYCFVKADWLAGLPMLANSSDETLASAAQLEIAAPDVVEDQIALGDAWWNLAAGTGDRDERAPLQQRAVHWYHQALPQLTDGLTRTKIEKRIAEVEPGPAEDDVPPQTVYLDDENEIDSKVANGTLGKHGWREDGKKRARFKGVEVEHCLSMHAIEQGYSYASYALNGQYREFQATAAVLDNPQEPKAETPLVFRVIGDGKLLWQSQPIQQSGTGQPCRIAVRGVRQLRLRVDCPGSGRSAWSAWIEPRVTKAGPTNDANDDKARHTARPLPRNLKFLFIMHDPELKTAKEACRRYNYPYETADSFEATRRDYRGIHTIMAGSNAMDYWGKDELKVNEAFQNIDAFVRTGGHLIVTGSFNGRNNEHLKRYGITTGYSHTDYFEPTEATAVFFLGNERIIPQDRKMKSAGNFKCSEPHTVLLARGKGSAEGDPAVITLSVGKGRVTFTLCEPEWQNDLWLVNVLIHWTLRGAPAE